MRPRFTWLRPAFGWSLYSALLAPMAACSSGAILDGATAATADSQAAANGAFPIDSPIMGATQAGAEAMHAPPVALDPVTGQTIMAPRAAAQLQGIGADPGPNPAMGPYKL